MSKYEWYTANDAPERDPVSWRLQASKDGKFWVDVDVQENATVTTERKTLAYAYTDEAAGSNGNGPVRLTLAPGTALTARGQDLTLKAAQLSGATLTLDDGVTTLDGLEVDPATGAGTIAGFAAAETGALALVNVADPTTACEIPLLAVESYAGESRPSLAKWTVTVNGTRRSGIVRVRDGKLELGASGFVILVK